MLFAEFAIVGYNIIYRMVNRMAFLFMHIIYDYIINIESWNLEHQNHEQLQLKR